ncbi:anti-sigma factor [Nocardiopsis dassonvillei]|uniref:hypothetical protein n=1 Tax=Nocardiopsis dassonvillei TaxID=2014 RepID=UPI00102CFBD5|nr:hypothetical protein [Nocardiopsis dassonvillei]MCP3015169.1 hypothetical protein [Nocardiopsis dassonvillei]
MAVDPSDDHDRLPCGTSVDALLRDLLSGRLTEHESSCEHCRAEAGELRPLVEAVRRDDEEEVTAPPGLLTDVMRVVRAERRSEGTIVLSGSGPGGTEVRESAVAAMLRTSVESVPGVVVGRCRVEQTREGLSVRATARVAVGFPIPDAADAARRAMRSLAEQRLGLPVARLDIDVVDLDDPAPGR